MEDNQMKHSQMKDNQMKDSQMKDNLRKGKINVDCKIMEQAIRASLHGNKNSSVKVVKPKQPTNHSYGQAIKPPSCGIPVRHINEHEKAKPPKRSPKKDFSGNQNGKWINVTLPKKEGE